MISPADWIRKARDQVKQVSLRLALFFLPSLLVFFHQKYWKIMSEKYCKVQMNLLYDNSLFRSLRAEIKYYSKERRVEKGVSERHPLL